MVRSRLVKTTALLLAMLHTMVGAAGESLHHWQLSLLATSHAAAHAADLHSTTHRHVEQYGHVHGPDFHWHLHTHEVEETSQEHAPDVAGPAARATLTPHEPHACPALSLIASLKHSAALPALVQPTNLNGQFLRVVVWRPRALDAISACLPRGPPSNSLA
ncbi:hypothetical protein Pan181_00050 [Aeoliella mucimassa]|uniref:Uncharacterized protein n=2 Tax=Aeoliella mucimassa TaxID=2527972 RepID=A0A518AGH6_9BACT|nr:hypothetical protein Pan181_00050 [Aeoliella mucimassa]